MIIALVGGLGNQMFQYAMGRARSLRENRPVSFDTSYYPAQSLRTYALSVFQAPIKIASPLAVFIAKARQKILGNPDAYLEGYWQSENYFQDYADTIRADFTLKNPLGNEAQKILADIRSSNAASLHIRRGDYAASAKVQAVHGLIPLSYYADAIAYIAEHRDNPTFFVFSDDILWAKENLTSTHPLVFVSRKGIADYEELALMSSCNDNILANSSFSWWGAWLNPHKEKIVIAPHHWFADNSKSTADLIPQSWIQL